VNSIWNGTIAFGEVRIPIGLAPTLKKGDVAFKTLHRVCGQPTGRAATCPSHGVVPGEELVKGYEVAKGQYVLVEDTELAELAPDASRTVPITACVAERELDPLAMQSRYYLLPGDTPLGRKPYLLLHQALAETGTVALTRFAAFGAEWIAAVKPHDRGRLLLLEKLAPQEDLVPAAEVEKLLAGAAGPDQAEASLAVELVEQLRPFRLRRAHLASDHRQRVRQLIEAKLAGEPLVPAQPSARAQAQTALNVDLVDALSRSLKRKRTQPRPTRPLAKR
jgi:DNA end-binding protein Ku